MSYEEDTPFSVQDYLIKHFMKQMTIPKHICVPLLSSTVPAKCVPCGCEESQIFTTLKHLNYLNYKQEKLSNDSTFVV